MAEYPHDDSDDNAPVHYGAGDYPDAHGDVGPHSGGGPSGTEDTPSDYISPAVDDGPSISEDDGRGIPIHGEGGEREYGDNPEELFPEAPGPEEEPPAPIEAPL